MQSFSPCSSSKPKDSVPSTTPPPPRNGGPTQPLSSASQHLVGQPQSSAGPSPHALRRGLSFRNYICSLVGVGGGGQSKATRSFLKINFSIRVCPFGVSRGRKDFYTGLSFSVLVTLQEGQRACFAWHWLLWLFHTKRMQNLLPN